MSIIDNNFSRNNINIKEEYEKGVSGNMTLEHFKYLVDLILDIEDKFINSLNEEQLKQQESIINGNKTMLNKYYHLIITLKCSKY